MARRPPLAGGDEGPHSQGRLCHKGKMRKKFLLRISPDLWEEINRWAKDELRSVNGQIEYVLRQAVKNRKHAGKDGKSPAERPD